MPSNICDDCYREIPTDAPGGLCPVCLLKAGLSDRQSEATVKTTPFSSKQIVVPTADDLQPFFPQYEVLSLLGQGGMGAVYHALQTKLDRPVALKIILPESATDPSFAERFTREAKTLAKLNHPNIVGIHDFGEFDEGYFFVMEYVAGANLRQILTDGKLQQSQALSIVQQICGALQYAHDQGVVHRDIKPENILVDQEGRVKIADFGLARLNPNANEEDAERYFTLTGTHQVMGTPRYMAPEQIEASSRVDHRADIYSLGVVFYEMLTGQVPMGSFEPPSQKESVDNRLDSVVLKAMAREPDRRYQQVSSLAVDINSIAGVLPNESHSYLTNATIYAAGTDGNQGFGTIFDRDARAVGPWVAGAFSGTSAPATRRAPVFVMLALCIIGIIAAMFPWVEVTALPRPNFDTPAKSESLFASDDQGPSVLPDQLDGQSTSTSVAAKTTTASPEMSYKNVLHGFSSPFGILTIAEFAVMVLILIAFPVKRQMPASLAGTLMLMSTLGLIGLCGFWNFATTNTDWLNQPLPPHVEGPLQISGVAPQLGYMISFGSAVCMMLLSAVGLRHAWAAEAEQPLPTTTISHDSIEEPLVGGSDQVTISRYDIEQGCIPNLCMHCGAHSTDVKNHTFEWQPQFFEEAARIGVMSALGKRRFRLPMPCCRKHRGAYGRFFLFCATGWLAPVLVGGLGSLPIIHFAERENEIPIIFVSVIVGVLFLTTLISWIVQMTRLYSRLPQVTRIENESISLSQVSWKFVRSFQNNQSNSA